MFYHSKEKETIPDQMKETRLRDAADRRTDPKGPSGLIELIGAPSVQETPATFKRWAHLGPCRGVGMRDLLLRGRLPTPCQISPSPFRGSMTCQVRLQ